MAEAEEIKYGVDTARVRDASSPSYLGPTPLVAAPSHRDWIFCIPQNPESLVIPLIREVSENASLATSAVAWRSAQLSPVLTWKHGSEYPDATCVGHTFTSTTDSLTETLQCLPRPSKGAYDPCSRQSTVWKGIQVGELLIQGWTAGLSFGRHPRFLVGHIVAQTLYR